MAAVRPVVIKYSSEKFSLTYDVIPFFALFIMQNCLTNFRCTIYELPPFVPNEFLFKKFQNKGQEKWEIYASSVREVMSKVGNLPMDDVPYRNKLEYEFKLGLKRNTKRE